MEKKEFERSQRDKHLTSARVGKFLGLILWSCLIFLLRVGFAILTTFVVGWFFGDTIISIFSKLGVDNIKLWEIAVTLSFIATFFSIMSVGSKKHDILSINIQEALLDAIRGIVNYAFNLVVQPFIGALYGFIIGLLFKDAIVSTVAKVGVVDIMPWELGVFIAFIGAFFVHLLKRES